MIIDHKQNAWSFDSSSLLVASDVQVQQNETSVDSARGALSQTGRKQNVRVERMESCGVVRASSRRRRYGSPSNGAIEDNQRGAYFQTETEHSAPRTSVGRMAFIRSRLTCLLTTKL